MILAHLSDLHLGHRGFDRWDRGVNLRERDVARAFGFALDALVQLAPDVIVVTGDVFDRPDPSPQALVTLTRGIESLHRALPETPLYFVAGARDTPRRAGDNGALAALDAFPSVTAATSLPFAHTHQDLSLHVQLIPHRTVLRGPSPVAEPNPAARYNVLATYGRVSLDDGPGLQLDPADWQYIALGSEHQYRQIAPRAAYAGALERVGSEPWREAGHEKGFISVDLDSGQTRFHPIPGRAVVALATTRAPTGAGAALRDRVTEVVREIPGGIAGKIVRVRLRGPAPGDLTALAGTLPTLEAEALHLSVEVEAPGGAAAPESAARLEDRALQALDTDAAPSAGELLERVLSASPTPGGPGGGQGS